jgi:hypothetical protein
MSPAQVATSSATTHFRFQAVRFIFCGVDLSGRFSPFSRRKHVLRHGELLVLRVPCHLFTHLLCRPSLHQAAARQFSSSGSSRPYLGRPSCLAMSTVAQRTPLAPYPRTGFFCASIRIYLPRAIELFCYAVRVAQIPLNHQTHFTSPPALEFYSSTLLLASWSQSRRTDAPAAQSI